MKLVRFLGLLLSFSAVSVSADLDVAAIKKTIDDGVSALTKSATEDAKKASDDFKIRDSQVAILVKTYSREDHEEFRLAEEGRLVEKISSGAQKLSADVGGIVEKAFIEVLRRQNDFDASIKKDIGVFKQQFGESIAKMLQGKKPTPITYSSAEAVAKPAEGGSGKQGMGALELPALDVVDKKGASKDLATSAGAEDAAPVSSKKGAADSKKADEKKSVKDKKDAEKVSDIADSEASKPFGQAKSAGALPVLPALASPAKPSVAKKAK
jgi:hypothetical protein